MFVFVCVCVYVLLGAAQDHIETNVEHAYNDVSHGNQQLERGVQLKVSKIVPIDGTVIKINSAA